MNIANGSMYWLTVDKELRAHFPSPQRRHQLYTLTWLVLVELPTDLCGFEHRSLEIEQKKPFHFWLRVKGTCMLKEKKHNVEQNSNTLLQNTSKSFLRRRRHSQNLTVAL